MMVCYNLNIRQPNMLMTDCGGLLYRYTNTDLQWESGSKLDARWGQCHSSYMTGSFLKILMKVLTPKNTYKIEFPISARQQFVYVYSLPLESSKQWWQSFPAKRSANKWACVHDKVFSIQLPADDFFWPKPSPWNVIPVIWEVLKPPISTSVLIPNPICMKGCPTQSLPSKLALQKGNSILHSSLPPY